MLSGQAIKNGIASGRISISPIAEDQINAAHVDLRLGEVAGVKEFTIIAPHDFVLGKTLETVMLPADICGFIEGRSSLAKIGISVEQSSKFIEPGSNNQMVLEIFNASDRPVRLEVGQQIAKMVLFKVVDEI